MRHIWIALGPLLTVINALGRAVAAFALSGYAP